MDTGKATRNGHGVAKSSLSLAREPRRVPMRVNHPSVGTAECMRSMHVDSDWMHRAQPYPILMLSASRAYATKLDHLLVRHSGLQINPAFVEPLVSL